MNDEQKRLCGHPRCYLPDTPCFLGEESFPPDCKYFAKSGDSEVVLPATESVREFPWTGNTFGLDDVQWLAAWGHPRVFVPVGAYNAGKTTFLVALYLALMRGASPQGFEFAGSFTFGGWENLAAFMRYKPEGIGPTFPPHTVISAKGAPGLLHLAFQNSAGALTDALLADGMGEWFSRWAINELDSDAEGARWSARKADAFLFFVDCDALSGPERGSARDSLFKLALRLSHHLAERPIAVVWTKSDMKVPDAMRKQVLERLEKCFPGAPSFDVSAIALASEGEPAQAFVNVLTWLIKTSRPTCRLPLLSTLNPTDPFLAYRGVE